MKKSVATPLVLILGGIVAAQIPASSPSSAPSTDPAPQTAPATGPAASPVTLPTTEADTQPATQAATGPTTVATSEPATGPASTAPSGFATSGPSSRPYYSSYNSFSSSRYSRRDSFRGNSSPTSMISSSGMDFTPKEYPRQYSAMLRRSIFIKGRQYVIDPGSSHDTPRPIPDTRPSGPIGPSAYNEGMLVFNGASDANGQLIAFVENTGMNQIARYHVGDAVGQGTTGRITAITLDSIDYTRGSRVTHVNLGQNLNGQDVQIITTQPVAQGLSTGAPGEPGTTQPSATPGGPAGLSDVERKMRERRMKELNGGGS